MALVNEACSIQAVRLAERHRKAHRLRLLLERGESEDVKVAREELQKADTALREAQVMIEDLKRLVEKLSPFPVSFLEEGSASTPDASVISSDHST
jgi:tRNA A37 threonylcarbamoyladenosine synthetase subunit TsaC/SUA5/YrdC